MNTMNDDQQTSPQQNGAYQVNNLKDHKPDVNLKRVAILNNTLVEYFCDAGAAWTLMRKDTIEKIKTETPGTKLEVYDGQGLRSVNSELRISGKLCLDRCLMSSEIEIKNAVCLVTPELSDQMCILRRDWTLKIPKLARTLQNMSKTVQEMSESIRERINEFPTMLKTKFNGQDIKFNLQEERKSPICGEIMVVVNPMRSSPLNLDGFNEETLIAMIEPGVSIEDPKVSLVRSKLKRKLLECSAKSLSELTPQKNYDWAFDIKFLDPFQKPIACKNRILPFHLKSKSVTNL